MGVGPAIAAAARPRRITGGQFKAPQRWVEIPDGRGIGRRSFTAVEHVPVVERPDGLVKVFAGTVAGATSSAPHFSALVGSEVVIHPERELEIDLDTTYEHAVLLVDGDCEIAGQRIEPRFLYYLGTQRRSVGFRSRTGGRVLFIGGPPFPETILMWW